MIYRPPGYCGRCGVELVRPYIHSFWPGDSPDISGEIHTEAKWGVNTFVRDNSHWHCQDGDSTEIEVSMLVAAMVRALQPELVIETGTAWGQTTQMIGQALLDNGHGHLVSLEIEEQRLTYSRWYCHEMVCAGVVSIVNCSSLEYKPDDYVDFLFSDSNYELRVPELEHFERWMSERSMAMFHDTAPGHGVGRIPNGMDLQQQLDDLPPYKYRNVRLHTPRGVTLLEVLH